MLASVSFATILCILLKLLKCTWQAKGNIPSWSKKEGDKVMT
jgi:hypothetical protein